MAADAFSSIVLVEELLRRYAPAREAKFSSLLLDWPDRRLEPFVVLFAIDVSSESAELVGPHSYRGLEFGGGGY